MTKRKCLLIGDGGVSSGFARMNHAYLDALHASGEWDVCMLALNYDGGPHTYQYPLYPCWSRTHPSDMSGVRRINTVMQDFNPDVIAITNDPWNFAPYLQVINGRVPVVGSVAVDGKNCRGDALNGLKHAIFWTQFGLNEARLGGYTGRASVVPLGVDLNVYRPHDKRESRAYSLPARLSDAFIVGMVGRNQDRKRLDLALMYFAEWIRSEKIQDAYLYLHVGPTGDMGYDLPQLARYLGITNRLIMSNPEIGHGVSQASLAKTYALFDVQLCTSQNEGWNLPALEGMACGIPQMVPGWAGTGEWPGDAAYHISCPTYACTPRNVNAIGGVVDKNTTIAGLDRFYRDVAFRSTMADRALACAADPRFRWESIGQGFAAALEDALTPLQA